MKKEKIIKINLEKETQKLRNKQEKFEKLKKLRKMTNSQNNLL